MKLVLEDDPCDIITKSMRGQELSIPELSKLADLDESDVRTTIDGNINPLVIEKLAKALRLSADALLNLSAYDHGIKAPKGLHMFTSNHGYLGVNSYLIQHGNTATVFDTGTSAQALLDFVCRHQLVIGTVYITHRHPDHTACIDDFSDFPIIYPEELQHGQTLEIGTHQLRVLDVSGHASPARAFYDEGLESPVCISGDSIFAGSMGKTPNKTRYKEAIRTASENILSLPENTIICPGHGPLTTVQREKRHNPFFRE